MARGCHPTLAAEDRPGSARPNNQNETMPNPKNLLFLLSDNHARGFVGAGGNPLCRTPHLDALAARGTLYENAYAASPLCCPSRAALATGRYPHQTGYWDNAIPFDGTTSSWMGRLRDAGHRTASIGKLHFRDSRPENGFCEEHHAMHILDGRGGVHMLLRAVDREPVNRGQWPLYMSRSGVGTAPYQGFDHKVTAEAERWLAEEAPNEESPWALFVSYPSAHPPFSVPEPFYQAADELAVTLPKDWNDPEAASHPAIRHLKYIMNIGPIADEAALRKVLAGYLALCAHLDTEIGKVLTALERSGLAADTRVIYTSDHGEMGGAHGLFGKFNLYEESIGVPLIMAGPDVPAGRRVAAPVSHVDLAPTIEAALGVAPHPDDADRPGISLWDDAAIAARDTAFAEYHAAGSSTGSFMLRERRWKLVYHVGMPAQLFDLETDPFERNDLGPDHPEAARLARRLREICDPEAVDARAKADQRGWLDRYGGPDAVAAEPLLIYTPPPGNAAEME